MVTFLIMGSWFVFVLLVVYTVLSGLEKDIVDNTDSIRKVWYLLFLLGCLVYITYNPNSLFSDWKNFLIALVGFIVIDSLVFLNLYFSKLGGHELRATKRQIDKTQMHLELTKNKVHNMEKVLNSYEYPSYTSSKEEYVQELENFLNLYAKLEDLHVDLLPYKSEMDKKLVVKEGPKRKIERKLKLRETYYSPKDEYMFVPLLVLEDDYVAKVFTLSEEDVRVDDIDVNIINMILMVYILTVKVNIDTNEGGVRE